MKTWIFVLCSAMLFAPVISSASTEGSKINIRTNTDDWDYGDDDWLGENTASDLSKAKGEYDSEDSEDASRRDVGSGYARSGGADNGFGETNEPIRFHLVREGSAQSKRRAPPNYKAKR